MYLPIYIKKKSKTLLWLKSRKVPAIGAFPFNHRMHVFTQVINKIAVHAKRSSAHFLAD